MVKCPYCGFDEEHKPLKIWKYRWWNSYFYQCSQCKGKFRYHVDPTGQRRSFIIKIGVKRR